MYEFKFQPNVIRYLRDIVGSFLRNFVDFYGNSHRENGSSFPKKVTKLANNEENGSGRAI